MAKQIFACRREEWKSFHVPPWFARMYGCNPRYLRVPVRKLGSFRSDLTLLVRMAWILFQGQTTTTELRRGHSAVFYGRRLYPTLSESGLKCALRTLSRQLYNSYFVRTSLIIRLRAPDLLQFAVTHY